MPWAYQLDLLDILENFNDIILFKARQLGWTWLLAGWASHKVRFGESVKGMLSSQGEKEARAFLAKVKYIHKHLPDWLQREQKHWDSRDVMNFADSDSILEVLPATSKAGRSTDATFVIRDELASHPNAKLNFAAIFPTVNAGGQLIDCSTIDQLDRESHFTERVQRAMRGARRKDLPSGLNIFYGGESGATLVFGGWRLRPVRVEGLTLDEWYDREVRPKMSPQMRRQEYPQTIEEALEIPEQSLYLDENALSDMMYQIKPALSINDINTRNGVIEVYFPSLKGEKYCIWTDPSNGDVDPFHTMVYHRRTGSIVCEATGYLKAEECAQVHDDLVRYYNNAHNSFEINAQAGGSFGTTLNNLKTPNQAPRRRPEGEVIKDKFGQYISPQYKRIMLEGLEPAVRLRNLISHRRETIEQFRTLVRVQGEELPRVPKHAHDDAIMSAAGVWQLQKYMPVGDMKVFSFQY